ncbi:hypothetical protein ACXZ65_28535 [Streptomyces aculeolatus]
MNDKARGAAMLKALRRRRGLSLGDTARALRDLAEQHRQPNMSLPSIASVQRSVARWESTRPTRPDDRYQLLLGHLYARTPTGDLALGPGSDFAELLDALAHLGEGTQALTELRQLLLRSAAEHGAGMLALLSPALETRLTAALANPTQADEDLLAGLRAAVSDVNAHIGGLPFTRLQLLLAPTVDACRRLLTLDVPEALLPDLRDIAVSAHTLAGRLAFEVRDDTAARAHYTRATQQAAHLPRWRRATVHMSHALTTLYSTPGLETTQRLVDAAVQDASSGESPKIRARTHALQAELAARAGRQRPARGALQLAQHDLDTRDDGDPARTSFTYSHLRGFEGLCELYTGNAATAHDQLAQAASNLSTTREQVQRTIISTDQALARVTMDEPRAAAELLHDCVTTAATSGGRVPILRLHHARRRLRPWRGEDFVADLDDHIIETLGR